MNNEKKLQYLDKIDQIIEKAGVAIQMVFDPDGQQVPFAYTVGNVAHGLPELFISGLPQQATLAILNSVVAMMRSQELVVADGVKSDQIFGEHDCVIRKVQNPGDHFGVLNLYCEVHGFDQPEVYQLVWPNSSNKFPWDSEVTESYKKAQDLLFKLH